LSLFVEIGAIGIGFATTTTRQTKERSEHTLKQGGEVYDYKYFIECISDVCEQEE
jgi:hypothetical protein